MPTGSATIRASTIAVLQSEMARCELDLDAELQVLGLPLDSLEDPFARVPLQAVAHLFDRLAQKTDVPCFGLQIAREIPVGAAGLLSHLAIHAPTVRQALSVASTYLSIFLTEVEGRFEETAGVGCFSWSYPAGLTAPRLQLNLFLIGILVRQLRIAGGGDWTPLRVVFDHRQPDCRDILTETLGSRLEFDADRNALYIDSNLLAKPMPKADAVMFAILQDLAQRWQQETESRGGIVDATQQAILARLAKGEANLDAIASDLALTPRALQWRLQQADTTFEGVLNMTRKSLATHLLRDTDRALTDIALDLGYAEPSVLTRAARRWFDMSPRAFRQQGRSS